MGFDLATAQPIQSSSNGFDLSTAKPIETRRQNVNAEPERTVGGFASNVVKSGGKMLGGLVQSAIHPIDTAKTMLQLGGGGVMATLPESTQQWIIENANDPEKVKQSINMAKAVGGEYAKKYGSWDGFTKALYEDPVGMAADFSALAGGGASLINAAKLAPAAAVSGAIRGGKAAQIAEVVAPAAGAIGRAGEALTPVANFLEGASKYTNVLAPVNYLASKGIEYGAPALATVAGKVGEGFNKELPQQKAAKILREMTGDQTEQIRLAARTAPANLTAAQAISGVTENRPQMQALAADVAERFPEKYSPKAKADERARVDALKNVTPDEAAALTMREDVGGSAFDRAMAADKMRQQIAAEEVAAGKSLGGVTGYQAPLQVTPELTALKGNPAIEAASREAIKLAATKGVKLTDPMSTLEGLHYMKLALDSQFKSPQSATALQKFSTEALQNTKQQLLSAIEGTANAPGVSPLYGVARTTFADLSAPVNQAQVLNKMVSILEGPGGAERVRPFLNALGEGQGALLKKSTGFPRYKDLEQVLTPEQMTTVNKVAGEMNRDLTMADQARIGRSAMTEILSKNAVKVLSPEFLNAKITLFNKAAGFLQGRISTKAMKVLGDAFESGKSLDDLMNTIPLKERNTVLKAINDAQFSLTPAQVKALGIESNVVNALSKGQQEQNQNALAR